MHPKVFFWKNHRQDEFFQKDFNTLVTQAARFKPGTTRVILSATDTKLVPHCTTNRYSVDKFETPTLTCQEYAEYDCISNEDKIIEPDTTSCNGPPMYAPTYQPAAVEPATEIGTCCQRAEDSSSSVECDNLLPLYHLLAQMRDWSVVEYTGRSIRIQHRLLRMQKPNWRKPSWSSLHKVLVALQHSKLHALLVAIIVIPNIKFKALVYYL